ncbi:aminoglycoside phosphotransferase family protein [Curtobacterium sp. 'Ferrero']|uniref:aminoglycoside phosphotransferase family protein n=1 Tax=Curtobacterium sp. 'Ferrero' TaxID=2033654 RepID=UPI001C3EEFE7|nr:aminoglycoside phosphotransferase family protein [Curtobacterium sp. 'Ferrero']
MGWGAVGIEDAQVRFLEHALPGSRVLADESWGLLDTRVFHVRAGGREYTVKTSGPTNSHFARELRAHRGWTDVLVRDGTTSALVAADPDTRVLVLDRIPGHLALGSEDESSPDLHHQAGRVLRRFHDQCARPDPDLLIAEHAKALAALDADHRIDPDLLARTRRVLRDFIPDTVTVVPTHGDWHPRNWIVDHGRLHVIDFGRFALRPAATDCTRLAVLYWAGDPALEEAFLDGYGTDPRDPDAWRWQQLREAIGTAVWAHAVRDDAFEAQGLSMLRDALAAF